MIQAPRSQVTLFVAAPAVALIMVAAPLVSAMTIDQAVGRALSNNLDLRAAYYEIEKARGRLIQAGLWPNPELEFATTTDRTFNNEGERTSSGGFQQAFPISGRLRFAKQVSRVDVAQAMAEIRNRERLLIGEVQRDFIAVLLLRQQIATNREFLGINRGYVETLEQRKAQAEVSEVDVNLAQVELQRLQLENASLEAELSTRELSLKLRLGLQPEQSVAVEGTLDAIAHKFRPEKYQTTMVVNRPDLRQTELGIDKANAEIRLAKAEAWADWTLDADYETERTVLEPVPAETDRFFGFKLSVPIALWNRNQGRVYEQRAAADQARTQVEALQLLIRNEIATGLARAYKLREIVNTYRSSLLPTLTATTNLLATGQREGLIDPTQFIQAQQQRGTLLISSLNSYSNYFQALIDLETASASSPFLKKDFFETRTTRTRRVRTDYSK
jgi:cobalt-zinc-cadmium efflux system outer membrane protein